MYIGQVVYMQQGTAGNLPSPPPSRWCRSIIIAIALHHRDDAGAFDAL
jgi:putative spermidine/putrescine transport system permease protein